MKYIVSINYHHFDFESLSDACTFCTLARRSNRDVTIEIEFIFEEEITTDEEN